MLLPQHQDSDSGPGDLPHGEFWVWKGGAGQGDGKTEGEPLQEAQLLWFMGFPDTGMFSVPKRKTQWLKRDEQKKVVGGKGRSRIRCTGRGFEGFFCWLCQLELRERRCASCFPAQCRSSDPSVSRTCRVGMGSAGRGNVGTGPWRDLGAGRAEGDGQSCLLCVSFGFHGDHGRVQLPGSRRSCSGQGWQSRSAWRLLSPTLLATPRSFRCFQPS